MKPQLGRSKLAILKHAPALYRKRRPVDLRNRHGELLGINDNTKISAPGLPSPHRHNIINHHGGPPALLRRQSTRAGTHKSFMDIDLPSIRALRREPSMMELDPPQTLFAPTPSPAHFLPGPWAFFQAAEAQRAQRQSQMEFLTRLQELRARDEQCFVQLMAGFAKECPIQFAQLTGFMKRMEAELAMAAAQEDQNPFKNSTTIFQQEQRRRHSYQSNSSQDWWGRVQEHRESRGTKIGLLELAQTFGNQVHTHSSHGEQFQRERHRQHLQQLQQLYGGGNNRLQQFDRRASHHGSVETTVGAGGGKEGRHGRNGRPGGGNNGGQSRSASMPVLRRGKTFQQQQQAMQQLTAYQRQLYQHVQQMYQQQQQQQQQLGFRSVLAGRDTGTIGGGGAGFVTSPTTIPLTYELMEYAAMRANMSPGCPASPNSTHSSNNQLPVLINSMASSPSSLSSSSGSPPSPAGPGSPLSPLGYGSLMGQFQQQYPLQQQIPQAIALGVGGGQQQQQQQYFGFPLTQDPLELAGINMHINMNSQGSSRRQRYKPTPVRTL